MMLNPPTSTDTAIITSINNNDDKDDDVFDLSSLDLFTASLPSSSSSSSTTITRFHLSPPHLETLSTSTTSSDPSTSTTIIVNNKIHNHNNAEDFHDCSSSVSSQETINSNSNVNDNTSTDQYININVNKRSVFTQYWNKTGQKPIPIRSMRSTFSSATSLIHTCDIGSASTTFLSSYSSPLPLPPSTSTVTFPEQDDSQLLCSVSNADLLEDDTVAKSDADVVTSITTPKGTEKRRRSILPAQKQNNYTATSDTDLIRETMSMNTSSWRKSTSLSSLQQRKRSTINDINTTCSNNNLHHNHQHRSLTRLSSSTTPSTSCLRSFQRYSPSKNDTAAATAVITAVMDSSSLDLLSASASSMLSLSSSTSTSSSCSSSSSVSSKSNVRFDLEVDVRHFEPPKEKYAHKGWSAQFF